MVDSEHRNGAKFSDDGKHRLALWRIWDGDKPKLMLIGLNPSKADAKIDDPTIRRVKNLAAFNGYGGVFMVNLFSYISTNPKLLKHEAEATHQNNIAVQLAKIDCDDVCFCWGNFNLDFIISRGILMKATFPDALCFGKNKNGSPKHPLYLKGDTVLVKYSQQL